MVPVVAYCERVAVPTVIGCTAPHDPAARDAHDRPDTEELSAILSHELAHIRRYDLWMNLLQRSIESLLFFHPSLVPQPPPQRGTRNLLRRLVILSGHQPMNYAGALLRMAELCAGSFTSELPSLPRRNIRRHESTGTSRPSVDQKSPSTRLSLNRK